MNRRFRLFNLGRRVYAVIGGITAGWDLYVSENTGTPLNTANQLTFVSANADYVTLDERLILSDSWYIEFISNYTTLGIVVGDSGNTTYIQYVAGNILRVRTSLFNHDLAVGFTPTTSDIVRVECDEVNYSLFVNGVFITSTPIVLGGGDSRLNIDYFGRRGTVYANVILRYLDVNGLKYTFSEGVGGAIYSDRIKPVPIILAGQSNAVSDNGSADGYPAELSTQYPSSYEWNAVGVRSTLQYPINAYIGTSAGFGVEYRTTYEIQQGGRFTQFLKYALGNTSIGVNGGGAWFPAVGTMATGLYDAIVASKESFEYLIWIQGENDADNAGDAANYLTNLTNLMAYFRTAAGSGMKIIIVRLYDFPKPLVDKASVQAAQDSFVANDPLAWIIDPSIDAGITDLDVNPDGIHYSPDGIDKLGVAISNLIDSIGYNDDVEPFNATITGADWGVGVDTLISKNTQTSIINRNVYDWFNGVAYKYNYRFLDTPDLTGTTVTAKFIIGSVSGAQNIAMISKSASQRFNILIDANRIGVASQGSATNHTTELLSVLGLGVGDYVEMVVSFTDYDNYTVSVNGVEISGTTSILNPQTGGFYFGSLAAGAFPFTGGLIDLDIDGTSYSLYNNYNGVITDRVGTTDKLVVSGSDLQITKDVLGVNLLEAKSQKGYDFTGQNTHHYATGTVVDTTSDSAWGFWAQLIEKGVEQIIFSNDTTTVKFTTSGELSWTFNGGTLVSDTTFNNGDKIYFGLYSDGSTGKIFFGDATTAMVEDTTTGAIGVGVASTTEVILGNDSGIPINGKVELFNHHPLPYTIAEFENDRNATKGFV